ncbi:MAG: hypothetical protein IKQ06_04895 [Bacilli bacterium]|nr:hypothetical protein [Bacilli bacterium]MBR6137475.1 hypothetical protein [Bacilli bacterium]
MNSNVVIEREKDFIDRISNEYNYDNNIRHLLYVIIPAFVIKYGINKEKLILNAFRDIKIITSNEKDKYIKAYYSSKPVLEDNEYKTKKYMVLQNYKETDLLNLLDNLVHEFNHAVNSFINEIKVTKKYIYLRTGLTYRIYSKEDLSFIKKDSSYLLEEIINTKQTEEIIDIIKSFDDKNSNISNTIYAINAETNHKYNSNSYNLESRICKQILTNRTFINTLANLRLNGEVYNINKWFDDITGEENSYKELIKLLEEIYELELKYVNKKILRGLILNKIRDTSKRIMRIIDKFDRNVNFR